MIELALISGIPPATWVEEGEQAIVTAFEVLEKAEAKRRRQHG